ncbi:SRPBCC family protein [Noviherbaspirillum sp.]|jgi:uncharacterized membrane protein|uniref:SRPBCC family protein n=1 Tax=Noviherbaspirillum sp. TaxID=1926288 RepID=UPI0025D3D919|nr:SRPBCC family protein [Noviherbaspirillum sp.]
MTRIQQSIEVGVPLHAAYHQLTRFEDYPRFVQDVDTVRQLDDTHLHWSSKLSYQTMEWDAEITEQQPDRCIAWRNTSGPTNAGRLELQAVGADKARVTLTMECEPNEILVAPDGDTEAVMTHRLEQDLACFKAYVEGREVGNGAPAAALGEAARSTQSEASLSQASAERSGDERFSVAEEQNFDAQSDQARRVGQAPDGLGQDAANKDGIRQAIERNIPPSE